MENKQKEEYIAIGSVQTEWKIIGSIAIASIIGYLLKDLFIFTGPAVTPDGIPYTLTVNNSGFITLPAFIVVYIIWGWCQKKQNS